MEERSLETILKEGTPLEADHSKNLYVFRFELQSSG